MSWDRLVAFAQAEMPEFLASVRGVSPADIERVESEFRVRLPENYRRFLVLMGEDSAGFQLFGPSQNQRLADLVAQRTEEDSYPPQDFFRISYSVDDSMVTRIDHFLDLSRSDGVDAPIVMFNSDDEFQRADVQEKGFTLLEQAYRRIFGHIADQRQPERTLVTIPAGAGEQGTSFAAIVGALGQMRFDVAIEPLGRVACLRRPDIWAVVAVHLGGRGFSVSLWSTERSVLEAVSDQLLVRFQDVMVRYRGRMQTP